MNGEAIDLFVNDATSINDKASTGKQDVVVDQNLHDHEAESHEHKDTNGHNVQFIMNGLSYRKLLEKEEMEECEEDRIIVMEDLTVVTSDAIAETKFKGRLKLVKDQVTSTFLILIGLLK